MERRRTKYLRVTALLVLTALVLALLGGAASSRRPITAEECFRKNRDAILYLRSYYDSGSLKATGSGFTVSEDGLVLTAAHVIAGGDRVAAVLPDESEIELTVLYRNEETDVAVLRLPPGHYKCAALAANPPNAGATVRAMGYPVKGTAIITEGLVNAQSVEVSGKNRMMVSCEIVNGMSGGPIFDLYGQVVGIVSGSVRTMEGLHLSVLNEALLDAAGNAGIKPVGNIGGVK